MISILDFGAVGDGTTLCTDAIQRAIDTCSEQGGGRVVVPSGTYLTGTVYLRSHVELHLQSGACLLGSDRPEDYNAEDAYPQNFGSVSEQWRGKHLILALECEDVAITGTGVIDGRGDAFFEEPKFYPDYHWMTGYGWRDGHARAKDKEALRPGQMICFIQCDRVLVENVTMRNSPCWTCFLYGCDNVTVRGIKIFNPLYFGQADGIDVDCCRFVTVSDCIIHTGDDGITFRCSGAWLKDRESICEYVSVTNCVISCSACGFRVGVGVGRIRHIRVSNVVIEKAGYAIQFMTSYNHCGEAHIEDVNFSDISAADLGLLFQLIGDVGSIDGVTMANMRLNGMGGVMIRATDTCEIRNVTLRNIDFRYLPEIEALTERRRASRGENMIFVSNVRGLVMDGVRVFVEDDVRQTWNAVYGEEQCSDVELRNCRFPD